MEFSDLVGMLADDQVPGGGGGVGAGVGEAAIQPNGGVQVAVDQNQVLQQVRYPRNDFFFLRPRLNRKRGKSIGTSTGLW
jgi:hypothetical protein